MMEPEGVVHNERNLRLWFKKLLFCPKIYLQTMTPLSMPFLLIFITLEQVELQSINLRFFARWTKFGSYFTAWRRKTLEYERGKVRMPRESAG